MATIKIGPHEVEISHPDKILFDDAGITKRDLVAYYERVAETMLPHLEGRALAMHRFPDGIGGQGFFQKEAPDHFPGFVRRATLPKEDGETTYVVCDNAATLVYLANQGCITPHVWLSRVDRPRHPDRMIFDLDPSTDDFDAVRATARLLREICEEIGLTPFAMTSGSRGIHVTVPLDASADFDEVRAFARDVAEIVMRRDPDCCTTETRKAKRDERIFLDVLRNGYAQHAVAPYAVRAKPDAPVATPLDWDEVGSSKLTPQRWTTRNLHRRLGRKEDPWKGIDEHAAAIEDARPRLQDLLDED